MLKNTIKETFHHLKQNWLKTIVVLVWLPVLHLLMEALNYLDLESCRPISNFNSFGSVIFLLLYLVFGCLGFFFIVVGFLNKTNRTRYWSKGLVFSGVFILCVPMIRLGYFIRLIAMENSAEVAEPILKAIEEFKVTKDSYPENLEELIPKFITKIPHTGMCAYPEFRYRKSEKSNDKSGGFELYISTSIGVLNWDEFIYRPSEVYGESFERVGKWAYYHE